MLRMRIHHAGRLLAVVLWSAVAGGRRRRWLRAKLGLVAGLLLSGAARGEPPVSVRLPDVAAAFESVAAKGQPLEFALDGVEVPRGGHLQGIQMRFDPEGRRYVAFLSHDSETAGYLLVVEFPPDLSAGRVVHVQQFPSDGRRPPLRHAGGMQLCGDTLVVGLEDNQDKTRSEVQFWNVARPDKPVPLAHLAVRREGAERDKTAGAVGLVQRERDHLLAVANWDSRAIDFYASNGKPLADAACRFDFRARWQNDAADKSAWQPDPVGGSYQAINLVSDAEGKLYLLGFDTAFPSLDIVDLFRVDLDQPPAGLLVKVAQRRMRWPGEVHFRFAGGLMTEGEKMRFLASPRNLEAGTRLGVAR